MKPRSGQVWKVIGKALHQLGRVVELLLILCLFSVCLLAFRLSFGPLELPELASRLATLASGEGISVQMQGAELAWAGYHLGGGVPFVIRLRGISVRNAAGLELAAIPAAAMVVPPADLFGARLPLRLAGNAVRCMGITAPVQLRAEIWPGKGYTLARGDFDVTLGHGVLGQPGLAAEITGGGFVLHAAPEVVTITGGTLQLAPVGASAPRIGFSLAARAEQGWRASLTLTADAVRAADLPAYWPEKLAPHARRWVVENITGGLAHDAAFTLGLSAPADLSALYVDGVSGGFTGQGLQLNWLKGAMPLTGLDGSFTMPDQDTAVILASAGHVGKVVLTSGTMTIHGIAHQDQTGDLAVDLAASLPDAFAVLDAPPLSLLREMPPKVRRAQGDITAHVMARIPFERNLHLADIGLHVQAALRGINIVSPLPPLALTDASGEMDVTPQTLRLQASGRFAGEPAALTLQAAIAAPGSPVALEMQGEAGTELWHYLGLGQETAASGPASGLAPFQLNLTGSSNGRQSVAVSADLTPAGIALPLFGWAKPPGAAGHAAFTAVLDQGQLVAVTSLQAGAPGLELSGTGEADGAFTLTKAEIGRTIATGNLTPPARVGAPWHLSLAGPVLDLRRTRQADAAKSSQAEDTPSRSAWAATLKFGTLYLAPAPAPGLKNLSFTGTGLGEEIIAAQAQADGLGLTVGQQPDLRRRLSVNAADTGLLLRAADLYANASGGTLALELLYGGGQPATGMAKLEKLRLVKASEVAKVLQAMTLYGVADAVSGPGMLIDHAIIPFSVQDGLLELHGARAFSSSLGFTAAGSIRLADDECSLDTTVVPAYALNTLLGKLPLLGRLFAAEKGGGLIAMRAHLSGPLASPKVSINPLSALTPGLLRGVFGFGGGHAVAPK